MNSNQIQRAHEVQRAHDADRLARALARLFAAKPPSALVLSRTVLRDTIALLVPCSQLEAQQVVDALIFHGHVVLVSAPDICARATRSPGRC